jgi:hypothetical protein
VLDVGGSARPFSRANYLIAQGVMPQTNTPAWPFDGGQSESFTRGPRFSGASARTNRSPKAPKTDFVVNYHALGTSAILRIGKAGYIERVRPL